MRKELRGRPRSVDSETLNKLEGAFSMDCTDEEACILANISPATLYNYQKANPDFLERKRLLKNTMIAKARSVLAEALNKKDKDTARWYLERKRRDEFATRVENDVNARGLNIIVSDEKTKEAVEDL